METRDQMAIVTDNGKGVVTGSDVISRENVRVVHLAIPSSASNQTHHSVTQSTPGSVQLSTSKGNVILLNKSTNVVQSGTTPTFHNIQVLDAASIAGSDGSTPGVGVVQYLDGGDTGAGGGGGGMVTARGRRELLSRRPSYRRILNELGGAVSEEKIDSGDDQMSVPSAAGIIKVIPASALQLTGGDSVSVSSLSALSGSSTAAHVSGGTPAVSGASLSGSGVVQYSQASDNQYFLPVSIPVSGSVKIDHEPQHQMMLSASGEIIEEVTKKREVRLLKNREAAKECRRKKKEYIKCLENRVAVLENQNKALIEELKSLKELYCQKR